MKTHHPKAIFIGTLPPPVTGMTLVTEVVVNEIDKAYNLKVLNISKKCTRRKWRFYKFLLTFKALINFLFLPTAPNSFVYLISNSGWGLIYNIIFVVIARVKSCKIYLHHHVYSYISKKDLRLLLLDRIMGRRNIHIVLCNEMKVLFQELYFSNNFIKVLPNTFIFPEHWKNLTPTSPKEKLSIGHISNLSIEKGLDLVLETFYTLKREKLNLSVRLILAGPIASKTEEVLINDALTEFPGGIEYRGPVYEKRKENFFDDIDVMLFPTKYVNEAQPLVLLEALLKGIPAISYDRGCIASMFDGQGGILIDSRDDFPKKAAEIIREWTINNSSYDFARHLAIIRGEELRIASKSTFNQFIKDLA